MSEVVKCINARDCRKRNTCYRHTAQESNWQWWKEYTPDKPEQCYKERK